MYFKCSLGSLLYHKACRVELYKDGELWADWSDPSAAPSACLAEKSDSIFTPGPWLCLRSEVNRHWDPQLNAAASDPQLSGPQMKGSRAPSLES